MHLLHPRTFPKLCQDDLFHHPSSSNHFTPPAARTPKHTLRAVHLTYLHPQVPPSKKSGGLVCKNLIVDTTTVERCICLIWEHRDTLFHLYEGEARQSGKLGTFKSSCLMDCDVTFAFLLTDSMRW
jgi:hypothetical protein